MKNHITSKDYLDMVKGDVCTVCEDYYIHYLKDKQDIDETVHDFILLLNWDGNRLLDGALEVEPVRDKEEYWALIKDYNPVIRNIVDNLVARHMDEEQFYLELWHAVSDDKVFAHDLDKICAIVCVMQSPKIPYFQLSDGLRMEDDEFVSASRSMLPQIRKAAFILNVGLEQRTEVASQLLLILNEFSDVKEKAVLMANILGIYGRRIAILTRASRDKADGKDQ